MKKATTSEAAAKPAKTASAKRASASAAGASKKASAPIAPVTKVKPTTVAARLDVGFGNLLFIRGDGPGLSWDRGVAMECASSDSWTWSTTAASRPFAYKVLVNDERWSTGDDYIASVGVENTVEPAL